MRNFLVQELTFADDAVFVAHNRRDAKDVIIRCLKSIMAYSLKLT